MLIYLTLTSNEIKQIAEEIRLVCYRDSGSYFGEPGTNESNEVQRGFILLDRSHERGLELYMGGNWSKDLFGKMQELSNRIGVPIAMKNSICVTLLRSASEVGLANEFV